MKKLLSLALLLFCLTPAGLLAAANAAPDATALAKSKADYPLKTCVVSGDELGSMGKPFEYMHQADGQPARLVLFCCKMCVPKFKKDPAKYLKVLDDAIATKTKA